jgi:hypothetical protein
MVEQSDWKGSMYREHKWSAQFKWVQCINIYLKGIAELIRFKSATTHISLVIGGRGETNTRVKQVKNSKE